MDSETELSTLSRFQRMCCSKWCFNLSSARPPTHTHTHIWKEFNFIDWQRKVRVRNASAGFLKIERHFMGRSKQELEIEPMRTKIELQYPHGWKNGGILSRRRNQKFMKYDIRTAHWIESHPNFPIHRSPFRQRTQIGVTQLDESG